MRSSDIWLNQIFSSNITDIKDCRSRMCYYFRLIPKWTVIDSLSVADSRPLTEPFYAVWNLESHPGRILDWYDVYIYTWLPNTEYGVCGGWIWGGVVSWRGWEGDGPGSLRLDLSMITCYSHKIISNNFDVFWQFPLNIYLFRAELFLSNAMNPLLVSWIVVATLQVLHNSVKMIEAATQ